MAQQPALGLAIAALRRKHQMTQGDLAASLGVSENFVWMVENGKRSISAKSLVGFAEAVGILPSSLNVLATNPIPGKAGELLQQTKEVILAAVDVEVEVTQE